MRTEILERDRSDANKLSNAERSRVVGDHGPYAFACGLLGALGTVIAAAIIAVLFF